MTISLAKGLAFCGLYAVLAGAGTAASAQGYHNYPMHRHPAIARQKAKYGRDIAHGNYRAAEQAHLRAEALRRRNREHRMMHAHGFHTYRRGY